MADRAQGSVAFTPIVTILADADADAVDAIHHNIKGSLGGDCTFTVADGDDNWFYAPNVICTTTSDELFGASDNNTDLVGASGDQSNGPNEAAGTAVTFTDDSLADCDADKVWFLFVKNTGTSDTSNTTTTNSVYLSFDSSAAGYNVADNIEIPGMTAEGILKTKIEFISEITSVDNLSPFLLNSLLLIALLVNLFQFQSYSDNHSLLSSKVITLKPEFSFCVKENHTFISSGG